MGPVDEDRARYGRVRELFHRACELDAASRADYLDQACGDDAEIRRELESLFALERPDLADVLRLDIGSRAPEVGRIGRYELLEMIGEGGFGTVYLAEQTEPVVRRVALKLIKAGMSTPKVLAGFESERQTLAVMDHPNIARLFDAGMTDDGRPYFVMELVRGEPVTTFCERERLSVARRLELFRIICGAVQHAHQKGIVHRDLKPSNVLVTVSNGTPEPKVIDFGISRPAEGPLPRATVPAEAHQVIGTLQYMSPEQVADSGIDIDTRSDVYALGVLLYELLTGSTPIELERVKTSPLAEIQRMIREEEPDLAIAAGRSRRDRPEVSPERPGTALSDGQRAGRRRRPLPERRARARGALEPELSASQVRASQPRGDGVGRGGRRDSRDRRRHLARFRVP